jgi:hypothetical protein
LKTYIAPIHATPDAPLICTGRYRASVRSTLVRFQRGKTRTGCVRWGVIGCTPASGDHSTLPHAYVIKHWMMNSVRLASGTQPSRATGRAGANSAARLFLHNTPDAGPASDASESSVRCTKTVKNTSEKLPNPAELKHHLLRKCANTTKCTSPCACVLTFSANILKELG